MTRLRLACVFQPLRNERGAILLIVLLFLVIFGSLTAALLMAGSGEVVIATNLLQGTQAQYLAEAGLQDAFNVFRTTPTLLYGAPTRLTAVPGLAGPGTTLAAFGTYTAQYQSVGANTIRVVATGTSAIGNGQRTVRATLNNNFSTANAVLVQGNLTMSGNATINGACGSVHGNGTITLSGNPTVTGSVTASSTYTVTGHPTVGAGSGGSTPTQLVPTIVPADFLAAAQKTVPANQVFQMKANGQVLDGNGALLTTLSSGQTYQNWTYSTGSPASWSISGNTASTGVYYFEGNASVSGNPGSSITPWQTTLIATGNITISGNPKMQALLTDTLTIAGGNITISGNPTEGTGGLIGAENVVTLTGNASINGFIIARDATSITDSISGNPTVTYNCSLAPPLHGSLVMLTWGR